MGNQQLFGAPLSDVINWQKNKLQITEPPIPCIVTETIAWLEKNEAHNEEGLFRIPGQAVTIENLKSKYEKQLSVDLSKFTKADIHTIASLLKYYLRELPEPLFIFRFYSTFLRVAKNSDDVAKIRNIKMLINGLPAENKATVFLLIGFLANVAKHEEINKMSSSNLALIFAPNLFRSEQTPVNAALQIMSDGSYITTVVRQMLEEYEFMLGHAPVPRAEVRRKESIASDDTQEMQEIIQVTEEHHQMISDGKKKK